jgi:hypothetical protein
MVELNMKWITAKESSFDYIQKMDLWHSVEAIPKPNGYKKEKPKWCIYIDDGDIVLQDVEKWQFYGSFSSVNDAKTFYQEIFNYE